MDRSDLPDIISEIMASPRFGEIMSTIKAPEPKPEPVQSAPTIPPDVLAKLPDIISALTGGSEDTEKITDKLPGVMSALSSMGKKEEKPKRSPSVVGGDANRKALLRALRPYMNPERQTVIDRVIQFSSMAEIMASLMGSTDNSKQKGEI
jgi:hypothetical protein